MLEDGVDGLLPSTTRGVAGSRLSIVEAFHLATVGGADLLDQPIGLLAVGRSFDALVVRTDRPDAALQIWDEVDDDTRVFEKVVRLATPTDISDVFASGRRVSGSPSGGGVI